MSNNELVKEKSWWGRNWKWVVPVGGCLTMIVLFFVFLGSVIFGAISMAEDSDAHKYAMERVNSNQQVIELLGEPIETGSVLKGGNYQYSYKNGRTTANLDIPIKGPKGEAMVYVEGEEDDDEWTYNVLKVIISDTGEEIDLLTD